MIKFQLLALLWLCGIVQLRAQENHWAMVVGGSDYGQLNEVELVSLDPENHPVPECLRSLAPYPLSVEAASGAELQGRPVVCGGYDGVQSNNRCYTYNPTNDSWSLTGELSDARSYAGSSLHPTLGLVMVGGLQFVPIQTAESTTDGITVDNSTIPDFGQNVHGNCLVSVNETTIISFGGVDWWNDLTIAVFTLGDFEWQLRTFTLTEHRYYSGCGLVTRPDGSQYAMVLGGNDSPLTSEVLDLNTLELSEGPRLPSDIGWRYIERSCVPYKGSFAIIGGRCNDQVDAVAWYDPATETFVKLEERLSREKVLVAAFSVNHNMFPPCQ